VIVSHCLRVLFCRNYIFGNLTCETFTVNETGFCAPFLRPLGADIIVNHSRVSSTADYKKIAVSLQQVLDEVAHDKCLEFLVPLLCRYVYVTCDPAFNDPIYQPICRHACDVISLFTCQRVWELLTRQLSILQFGILDTPQCEPLENANGGDAPDCIDTTDGGMSLVLHHTHTHMHACNNKECWHTSLMQTLVSMHVLFNVVDDFSKTGSGTKHNFM